MLIRMSAYYHIPFKQYTHNTVPVHQIRTDRR